MNKTTFQYKFFDLACLTVLAVISECMGRGLLKVWNSDFYFSFATAICLIAIIRWGLWGVIAGVCGGIAELYFSGMSLGAGILFCVIANGFIGLPVLVWGQRDRNRICGQIWSFVLFIVLSHVSLAVGKGISIYILTGETTGVIDYFGATLFLLVINIIVCLVLRTRDGLICDMRYYFERAEESANGRQKD